MLNRIDHTALRPITNEHDIGRLCKECKIKRFRGVCIPPNQVKLAADLLRLNDFKISTVIGFPLGFSTCKSKLRESEVAIEDGANELDVVWNIGGFLNKEYLRVVNELAHIVKLAGKIKVKVIVEECYIKPQDRGLAYSIVRDSGAWCIKTSTGYGRSGANVSTVREWGALKGLQIKAAGGIKTLEDMTIMVDAGANIIGTSSGLLIAKELSNV